MNSETPPTISMALVNPQMPSVSADSRNSSTQQLSISVWVECIISRRTGIFSEKGGRYASWWACQGLNPRVLTGVPSCTPIIHDDQRSWSWRKERWLESTANSKKGGCVGCHSERAKSAFYPATTSHLCWGEMLGFYWWQWELINIFKLTWWKILHCLTAEPQPDFWRPKQQIRPHSTTPQLGRNPPLPRAPLCSSLWIE